MSPSQQQKVVLITGCSLNSIGSALAIEFHRRGFHVVATARSTSRLEHLVPYGIQTEELDVTSSASIQALRSKVQALDILVNNAGAGIQATIADTDISDWRRMMDVNFFSAVQVTHAFLPLLLASKGIIVNNTSINIYTNFPAAGSYSASKAALSKYTGTLACELEPFGVRVVELVSGVVKTNIVDNILNNPATIPTSSIYAPVKKEFDASLAAREVEDKGTLPEVYARKVVSDLLDSWGGPPRWIWRGFAASLTYWLWFFGCFSKGLLDPMWRKMTGLHLLKDRLEKDKEN